MFVSSKSGFYAGSLDYLRTCLLPVSLLIAFLSVVLYSILDFTLTDTLTFFIRTGYLLLLLIIFIFGKQYQFSRYVFIIATQLFAIFTYINPQLGAVNYIWVAIVPILAILLLGKWAGLIDSMVFFIVIYTVFHFNHLPQYNVYPKDEVLQFSIFLFMITGFVFYFQDILEKAYKQIQLENDKRSKLEQTLHDYESAIEFSTVSFAILDQSYRYIVVNQAYLDQRNLERSQVLGQPIEKVLGATAFKNIAPYLEKCFQGQSLEYETIFDYPNMGQRSMLARYYPVFDQNDKVCKIVATIRDITQFKILQNERQRLFDLSIDALCVAGFDGYFKDVNPAWGKMLGWSREEILKKPWLEFVHPEDRQKTIQAGENLLNGENVINFENRYLCKDGSYRWLSWNSFSEFLWEQIFAVVRDVTEQKQMEKEREELINKLQNALDEVKTLQGIIPICSHCKKIRDEEGAWNQLEAYISRHSEALFSHGICPDCIELHFPEYKKHIDPQK